MTRPALLLQLQLLPVALTNVTFAGNWSCTVALAAGPVPLLVTVKLYVLLAPTTNARLGWDLSRFSVMPLLGVLVTGAAQPAVGLFWLPVQVAGAGGVVPPVGSTAERLTAVAVLVVVTTILTTGALAPAAMAAPL